MLEGIKHRHEAINVPVPNIVIVDNCCQVRRAISQKMPGVEVVLDVLHFVRRYGAVILNGTRNPRRGKVLQDIRNAIISQPARGAKSPTRYYSKEEQATRLQSTYNHWLKEGGVWSAPASKVHSDQMAHVTKGCLARSRQDIRTDGSRIEGSHKAWNSLQRAQPSGLEVYNALAHDHVHRRNIRIATSAIEGGMKGINSIDFLTSTHGLHHTKLVSYVASKFNVLRAKENSRIQQHLSTQAVLREVVDDQKFGLVVSAHSRTFGGLLTIKDEVTEEEDIRLTIHIVPEKTSKRKQQPSNTENEPFQPLPPSKRVRNEESLGTHTPKEVTVDKSQVKAPADPSLTRSQLLFSVGTQVDVRSLSINSNLEFYLFMEMRDEFRWTSFGMTSHKWVSAVKIYNQRLVQRGKDEGVAVMAKSPRALMDKLSEIETRIFERVSTNNFKSRKGGEHFWKQHCFAVPELVNLKQDGIGGGTKKTRKIQMCSRCQTVMYPGPNGCPENHKKGYCADGVQQVPKDKSTEGVPPWPQPQGIFRVGKEFHVLPFLSEVHSLYEKNLKSD
ncbi:hypothetical protein CPB83DRAFT_870915 [Crepidotus variabilis]|uniref:Transposase n=1 Tax=Crepidotus variabilis TaxID=179855 RepID=A0A9P6JM02_9AGAR|nr:hypothetical protein CPB83DRAFT_870915 [Crepidotus variabilis]